MPKKCSSHNEVDVIDNHVHVKGSLLVDGVIASKTSPQAIIVTQQKDLCYQILASFVPIIIPPEATLEDLVLDLPSLYNRHLEILNLSNHTIRLTVPINNTLTIINLATQRHTNITIFATCNFVHTVVETPNNAARAPTPGGIGRQCFFNHPLGAENFFDFVVRSYDPLASVSESSVTFSPSASGIINVVLSGHVNGSAFFQLNSDNTVDIHADQSATDLCFTINEAIKNTPPQPIPCTPLTSDYVLPVGKTIIDLANYLANNINYALASYTHAYDITRTQVTQFVLRTTLIANGDLLATTTLTTSDTGSIIVNVTGSNLFCRVIRDLLNNFSQGTL